MCMRRLGIEHFKSEKKVKVNWKANCYDTLEWIRSWKLLALCISMNTKISVFIPLQYGNNKIAVHFWKYQIEMGAFGFIFFVRSSFMNDSFFFSIVKQKNYRLFSKLSFINSICFVRFLSEQPLSKIVCAMKSFV